mgnify:CR=1 FL=1
MKKLSHLGKLITCGVFAMACNTALGDTDLLIAPSCFMEMNKFDHKTLATNKSLVLFQVDSQYFSEKLLTIKHTKVCGKFINAHDDWENYIKKNKLTTQQITSTDYQNFFSEYQSNIEQNLKNKTPFSPISSNSLNNNGDKEELIKNLIDQVNNGRAWSKLKILTNFYNRGAKTDNGVQAAAKIRSWVEEMAKKNNKTAQQFSIEYVYNKSSSYKQPSVVAILGKDLPGNPIVIGAHMDTLDQGRMPGADDDGSGSAAVLEVARVLFDSQHKFTRPIYLIWYSAEEAGLVGSKSVVPYLTAKNIKFDSVLNLDMVGTKARNNDPAMWFLDDNVDMELTNYLIGLVKQYLNIPTKFTRCGYGCSDHATWYDAGIPSAAGFESAFDDMNSYIHTENDGLQHVSIEWLTTFSKMALAFAGDKAG